MRAQNSEIDPIAIAAELGEAIRQQVIPRLLSAHGCAAYETRHDDARLQMQSAPGLENHRAHAALDVAGVAHLAVRGDAIALDAACRHMIDAGMSRDDVFLDRLAPAARLLGEFWRDDTYGFADVALGVCRLRQTFESLRTDELEPQERPDCFRVLIAPAPRETHGFGAAMIGRLFSQAGWAVTVQNPGDEDTVLGLLRTNRFELLGLSLNTDLALEGLSAFVLKAKRESKNQNLTILVGGSLIAARPEIAREVGVIAAPSDPRRAIDEAEKIVRRAVRRR
jgi:methanogenic corrinoid protein MtbC1